MAMSSPFVTRYTSPNYNDFILRTKKLGTPTGPTAPVPTLPSSGQVTPWSSGYDPITGAGRVGPGSNPVTATPTMPAVKPPPPPDILPSMTALDPNDPNVIRDPGTGQLRRLTDAEIRDRARAQGSGAAAQAASAAATAAGQHQQQAQASAMSLASKRADAMAAPTVPIAGAPEPDAAPSLSDKLYDDVLKQLAEGINSDKPLPGTAAQIAQNRQALATYAKGAQAAAGRLAAKGGSLGQGTANSLGQKTRQDVLTQLSNAELENTKLVSAEKQGMINDALQAGQFGKTAAEQIREFNTNMKQRQAEATESSRQFNETMAQRKAEFDTNFGAQEAASYRNQLERMAVDNPVLAAKLTDYLLDGKTGALGSFTAEEKAQIAKYAAEKKGQQDKLTAVYDKILESLPDQIKTANNASTDAETARLEEKTRTELVKKLNTMPAGNFLSEDEFKTLEGSQDLQKFTLETLPRSQDGMQTLLQKSPSGIISIGGKQYRYVKADYTRTSYDNLGNPRHTDFAVVQDSSGNPFYVYDGKLNTSKPRKVGAGDYWGIPDSVQDVAS